MIAEGNIDRLPRYFTIVRMQSDRRGRQGSEGEGLDHTLSTKANSARRMERPGQYLHPDRLKHPLRKSAVCSKNLVGSSLDESQAN